MSHITLPANEVISRCEQFLQREQDRVRAMQEPLIRKAMKPKLFGLIKGKTYKEATQHLEDCASLFGPYHLAKLSGCIEVSMVADLLALAKMARKPTDHVVVSADVARYIA